MPLGKGGPHERGGERGAPPRKKALFYRYWLRANSGRITPFYGSSNVNIHSHAAYCNKHWRQDS